MSNHILVPLDGSPLAECVLPHAVAIARAFESQVTLLRVLERPSAARQTQAILPMAIKKAFPGAFRNRATIVLTQE